MALYLLARCFEYSSGGNGPDDSAVGDGLYFCRAHHLWSIAGSEPPDAVLSRQDHYHSLLVPRDILSECFAFCLSLFPLFADPLPCPQRRSIASSSDRPCRGVLLRDIESGAVKHLWPVGVLSPSPADHGQSIRNIPVQGGIEDFEDVIADFARRNKPIARLIMTPSAFEPDARPESVLMRARRLGLIVSRLPSLESGETPRLTNVAVEDLLLRPSGIIDYARLERLVKSKAVIVTGGGGSIGSEICEGVATFGAARLLVIENSEPALYSVIEGLAARRTDAVIEGRIADIRDRERILRLMSEFKPDIVFHAAALKHVPILERDWSEGVKTNIFGSINVADAA